MLFSTNYFGSIPYFQSIAPHNDIIIDIHEQYNKQSWRNRTQILESNGPMYLSVPVTRPNGSKTLVKDVSILDLDDWRKDHWKAIESSYKHAPYFFYYGDQIKELIYQKEPNLSLYNLKILVQTLEWLDLEIQTSFSESYVPPKDQDDYRISLDRKYFSHPQELYIQVFSDKLPFYPNLSILDLIMNQGPLSRNYIFPKRHN